MGIITVLFLICNYIKCYDIVESSSSCVDLKPQNVNVYQVGVQFFFEKSLLIFSHNIFLKIIVY